MPIPSFAIGAVAIVLAYVAGATDGRAWSAAMLVISGILVAVAVMLAGSEAYASGLRDADDIDRE